MNLDVHNDTKFAAKILSIFDFWLSLSKFMLFLFLQLGLAAYSILIMLWSFNTGYYRALIARISQKSSVCVVCLKIWKDRDHVEQINALDDLTSCWAFSATVPCIVR